MNTLAKEQVLRVNCPGFGVSSTFKLGDNKDLSDYKVIVVNPASILHLFEQQSDTLRQIEILQVDGMTSYQLNDDELLQSIASNIGLLKDNLNKFFAKGGLLIYFLAPPFSIGNSTTSFDNYSWLGNWVPDKSTGPDSRNMSATIRGKVIETTDEGAQSPFNSFFKLSNIEWSTIIRSDNLSKGYIPLATAGSNKCVSAYLDTNPGQIVFLPFPFEARFEDTLKDCIMNWWNRDHALLLGQQEKPNEVVQESAKEIENQEKNTLDTPKETVAEAPAAQEEKSSEQEKVAFNAPSAWGNDEEKPSNVSENSQDTHGGSLSNLLSNIAPSMPTRQKGGLNLPEFTAEILGKFDEESKAEIKETPPQSHVPESSPNVFGNGQSKAEDLMKKMEDKVIKQAVPDWCDSYTFDELNQLKNRLTDLNDQVKQAQNKISQLSEQIGSMEDIKNALIFAEGPELAKACTKVFELMGWQVTKAGLEANDHDGLWLLDKDKIEAIVQTVYTQTQAKPSDLAKLAASVSSYWGSHEIEPKGVLVVSTWADRPPSNRTEEDFTESMNEFAQRKGLSLLTTSQLLWIYTDIMINDADAANIRRSILATNGCFGAYPTSLNKKGQSNASNMVGTSKKSWFSE